MKFFNTLYYELFKYHIRIKIKFNISNMLNYRHLNWYDYWIEHNEAYDIEEIHKQIESLKYKPLISILLPVYNVSESYLKECIESVLNQVYTNWELCIADDNSTLPWVKEILNNYKDNDKRIKVVFREDNGHISACSNTAMQLVTGEYLALLDNDDTLSPLAIYEIVKELNEFEDTDVIFTNEDKLVGNKRVQPFFKKNWNLKLLYSMNFFCHLVVYRTSLIREIGGFRVGYEGVQDWDLAIRVTNLTRKIRHIPKVLYHWRISPTSTAGGSEKKPYIKKSKKKMIANLYKQHFGR